MCLFTHVYFVKNGQMKEKRGSNCNPPDSTHRFQFEQGKRQFALNSTSSSMV